MQAIGGAIRLAHPWAQGKVFAVAARVPRPESHMSIQQAYSDWSATYDSDPNRTRDLDAEIVRKRLGGLHRRSILELGCGSGKNTAFLVGLCDKLVALDFSEGMLVQARAKVTATHVTFAVADLTRPWPCEVGAADLVVGNLVLEHIGHLSHIFAEAARCLAPDGQLFLSELHPFRQYQGTQANFQRGQQTTLIPAFTHNVSDYLGTATAAGLQLAALEEWWHTDDAGKPPRLITFLFRKAADIRSYSETAEESLPRLLRFKSRVTAAQPSKS